MPKFRPPKLPKDFPPTLGEAFRQLFDDLAGLLSRPGDVSVAGSTYRPVPGEVKRVSPPAAGMGFVLPPPSADNRAQTITAILEKPQGALRVFVSLDGPAGPSGRPSIDGDETRSYSTAGAVSFISNGVDKWSESRGPTGAAGATGGTGATGATGAAGQTGLSSITSSSTQTNSTTNVSGGTTTIAANPNQGAVYRYTGHMTWVKTVSTATGPTVELTIGGNVVAQALTNATAAGASAETVTGPVMAFFTVKTTGATGTTDAYAGWYASYRQGISESDVGAPVAVADDTVNWTVSNVAEVRVRMASAVLANSITMRQGFWELVKS